MRKVHVPHDRKLMCMGLRKILRTPKKPMHEADSPAIRAYTGSRAPYSGCIPNRCRDAASSRYTTYLSHHNSASRLFKGVYAASPPVLFRPEPKPVGLRTCGWPRRWWIPSLSRRKSLQSTTLTPECTYVKGQCLAKRKKAKTRTGEPTCTALSFHKTWNSLECFGYM